MRIKITIGLIALLLAIGFVLHRSAALAQLPPALLAFSGYTNDGRNAMFTLTNCTADDVGLAPLVIQLRVNEGWADYEDSNLLSGIITGDFGRLPGHRSEMLSVAVPSEHSRWRAAMRCTVYAFHRPGSLRSRLDRLLQVIGLHKDRPNGEFTLLSDEIVR